MCTIKEDCPNGCSAWSSLGNCDHCNIEIKGKRSDIVYCRVCSKPYDVTGAGGANFLCSTECKSKEFLEGFESTFNEFRQKLGEKAFEIKGVTSPLSDLIDDPAFKEAMMHASWYGLIKIK